MILLLFALELNISFLLLHAVYPCTACQLPYTRILSTLLHVIYPCTVCQLPYTRIVSTLLNVIYPCTACQLPYRETNHIQVKMPFE